MIQNKGICAAVDIPKFFIKNQRKFHLEKYRLVLTAVFRPKINILNAFDVIFLVGMYVHLQPYISVALTLLERCFVLNQVDFKLLYVSNCYSAA